MEQAHLVYGGLKRYEEVKGRKTGWNGNDQNERHFERARAFSSYETNASTTTTKCRDSSERNVGTFAANV